MVFWLKYIFRIKFNIPILHLMLLPKNSVPFEELYSSSTLLHAIAPGKYIVIKVG